MAPARAAPEGARKRRPTLAEVRKMINVVPDADIKKFLAAELRKDEGLLARFGELTSRSLADSRGEDYYAKVKNLLDRASGGGPISHHTRYISLADVMKDARAREKIGDHAEAARIYGQIASAIIDYLPMIYSVADRFRNHASRCILAMGECAEKAGGAGERRRIARYLADAYARDYDGMWVDEYEASLDKVIQARGDKERLLETIEKVLSAGPPDDRGMGKRERDGWGEYLREYRDGVRNEAGGGPEGGADADADAAAAPGDSREK